MLTFNGTINSLDTLIFRHGEKGYGTGYVTIDNSKVEVYTNTTKTNLMASVEHGLSLTGNVNITFSVNDNEYLSVSIVTVGGSFNKESINWFASKGMIEMESVNSNLSNVSLSWDCDQYDKDIWVFGDSYLGTYNSAVWPYHVLKEGYDNCLYSGYPGATSKSMYSDWKTELTHGKPTYAVWCLGMNNGDTSSAINSEWKTYVEAFIADCEANGIIPVLTTIPNTPTVNHTFKNSYVRNSGCRYIDFASAVGATEKGSSWYDGMLSSDNVHATSTGAKALAEQFILDLPEVK